MKKHNLNPLVAAFGSQKQWVTYRKVSIKGRTTKVPYTVTNKKASSTDPLSWSTYAEAKKASDLIGIVFSEEKTILGIDIDHCLTDGVITHPDAETIAALCIEADTYTEISPSGEGLHLYLALSEPLTLTSNKKAPFEAYTSGRFFTVTENPYKEAKPVRTVTPDTALNILSIIGYPWSKVPSNQEHGGTDTTNTSKVVSIFSDQELTSRMFRSKGGEKLEALYNNDLTAFKGDASSADLSFCGSLAFWTRKDREQMERIWLASPLGQREKVQKRLDYRNRTLDTAIASCTTIYEPFKEEVHDIDFLFVLTQDRKKKYIKNTENVVRALSYHDEFKNTLRLDLFKNRVEIIDPQTKQWRAFIDSDAIYLQTRLSVVFEFLLMVSKDMVFDAVIRVAKDNAIDSAADFIRSLQWDSVPRLDSWLSDTYGTPNDTYHQAVGSNWLKGLVKRIIEPGSKFDYVLVLEGPQGVKKSTSLGVLGALPNGDNWHVESTMSTDTKDFFMQFEGKAIVEFSEGETLSRTEVKKMKSIITTSVDRYRPSYGRISEDFPRHCVFAMTTNQDEYLKDDTGNRRWLPVRVLKDSADIEWLKENRDQLLAEAYQRVCILKETTYEFPEEETLEQQRLRQVSDPHEDVIEEWYYREVNDYDKEAGITVDRVYKEALHRNMPTRPMNKFEQMSIAAVLKNHLGLTSKQIMTKGIRSMRWFNTTGKPMKITEGEETLLERAVREESF